MPHPCSCDERKLASLPFRWMRRLAGVMLVLLCLDAGTELRAADASPAWMLTVKTGVVVSGQRVTLADVAENPASLPAGWGERPVFDSPGPGKAQIVPLIRVASALRQYPDMVGVTLRGAPQLAIRRDGVPVDSVKVQAAVDDYVTHKTEWKDLKIQAELTDLRTIIMAGSTNAGLQVTGFEYDPRSGAHLFLLEVQDGSDAVQRLKIPVKISALSQVWVAARSVKRGAVLRDDDARAEWLTTNVSGHRAVPASDPIAGYETERQILAGEPILKTAVRQPMCTEKGDMVEVTARRGSLEVSLRAKALNKGRRGDQVICVNDSSKRQLLARLTAPGKAVLIGL